ncbi:hypothetical protein BKA56DRAFT_590294 [Ilyonectria sp. MPI-CAGE-AT-0026]|nr:hypothetical protein BKA56DRAFT_590294 [Ilyonectria sp. MPI-CAGE-AT-0026]
MPDSSSIIDTTLSLHHVQTTKPNMLLNNFITATALGLISFAAAKGDVGPSTGRPCGFKIAPCPQDTVCIPNAKSCKNLKRCAGTCHFKNNYRSCGGFTPAPAPSCPRGTVCKDDPRFPDSCGMACDAPGICISKRQRKCGGFAGFQCPYGLYCYDVLHDGCDPKKGGADCMGICL